MSIYGPPFSPEAQQFPPQYQSGYQQQPQPFTPPSGGQISPGTITYTTSTGADGRVIYHPFKAVPASYQTSSGVVSGIQWVPAEATQVLPSGAQPANADFAASWNRGYLSQKDQKALKEWQRDEEKRRKKEEKESHRRLREKEHDESELRRARERDAQAAVTRERRKSFNQPISPPLPGYPITSPQTSAGYPAGYPYSGGSDLDRRFGDMDIGGRDYEDRKYTGLGRPGKYSVGENERPRDNYGDRSAPYGSGTSGYPSTRPGQPYSAGVPHYAGSASPNMRTPEPRYAATAPGGYPAPGYSGEPLVRSTSPYGATSSVYPRGHILEGQPIPRSRATTPIPGAMGGGVSPLPFPHPGVGASPRSASGGFPEQQLAAPEGFSRPINAAQPYTPFEMMKVQSMDELVTHIPRMPLVLQPHDVYNEDWSRFMQDLSLVWSGRMPVPELSRDGRTPKRATLAADLVDTWNKSFFVARGVEVVLFKGQERRSGADAGMINRHIPLDENDSLSSSSSESSSDNDSDLSGDDRDRYGQGAYGAYGRQPHGHDSSDARRRRHEKKDEKKRRAKEKKRRAKDRQRTYALYLTCVAQGNVVSRNTGTTYAAGGYGGMGPAGGAGGTTGMPLRSTSPMPGMGPIGGRVSPIPMSGGGYGGGGYGPGKATSGYSGVPGGHTSPMPVYSAGGRTSPMPGYPGPGRASPMPGYPASGRASPMPAYPAGRMSPMPGYPPSTSGIAGRTSPMPGGYAGGRAASPMPGGY